MSIRTFWAVPLIAFSVLTVLAQGPDQEPEPSASFATVDQRVSQTRLAAAAANLRTVAWCNSDCTGLSASTGNLYFTSYDLNEFGPSSASFYRVSKNGTPGSESLLYREFGAGAAESFGNPVWANVNGTYYGYFSAKYNISGQPTYQIKRVPLGGGAAIVLVYLPGPINSLETDGSRLYWADSTGIRSMPIGGGAIQNLLSVHVTARFGIRLDSNYVYYSIGRDIRRIPKVGGTSTTLVTAPDVITAFHVNGGFFATVLWGEQGGAVRTSGPFGIHTYQYPWPGRGVTSVGFDGTRLMWIDCTQPGNSACAVKTRTAGGPTITVANGGVLVRDLQWDATSIYWRRSGSIVRYDH